MVITFRLSCWHSDGYKVDVWLAWWWLHGGHHAGIVVVIWWLSCWHMVVT